MLQNNFLDDFWLRWKNKLERDGIYTLKRREAYKVIDPIQPMEPKLSEQIPSGKDWVAQVKWDGVRILTYSEDHLVRLFNRKKHERTYHYPELAEISRFCKSRSVVLDGEVIALEEDGKPSFHQVMRRDNLRKMDKIEAVRKNVPITYMIFDLLYYNNRWLFHTPLVERLKLLEDIIIPQPDIQLVSSYPDGADLFRVIKDHDLEGIVMKQLDSFYYPGEKKDVWLKVKNYKDLVAVVGGFTLNGGVVNTLLLGLYDEQGYLWYIGHVGTGKLSKKEWRDLIYVLQPLIIEEQPFVNRPQSYKDVLWVQPSITVKVQYTEWTEGRLLRQPSIQGFVNRPPQECII